MHTHSRVSTRPLATAKASADPLTPTNDGVLVLSGYGLHIGVERGQLALSDGVGRARRTGTLAKATTGLKRLVVLGHSGAISFEALRWLADIRAAFIQIDLDGNVLVASVPAGLDDARLRRAQAMAPWTGVAGALTRELLRRKLEGQAQVLAALSSSEQDIAVIDQALAALPETEQADRFRLVEAAAATAYWAAWSSVLVRFAKKDADRVPAHWRTVGTRSSPLSNSPRSAANPANALLNYLYAILEAEARIALLTVGLDPGIGVLHTDQRNRDSLACDVIEAVRPQVDAYVLQLLQSHLFSARDFFETRQGVCRLMPPLTHLLAETSAIWAKAVAPIAEEVAQTLFAARETPPMMMSAPTGQPARSANVRAAPSRKGERLPTKLTERNRSHGRDGHRRASQRVAVLPRPDLPSPYVSCGVLLPSSERQYCDDCLPERRTELAETFQVAGPQVLAKLRAQGADPAHGGDSGQQRGRTNAQHQRDIAAWEGAERDDAAALDFQRDILPRVRQVSLNELTRATGLSLRYCWLIRRGERIPHPRHWAALASVNSVE
jgi:CRISPR-associated endonuclease Cas1